MDRATTCGHSPYYAKNLCRKCYERDLRRRNPEFAERQRENCRKWSDENHERKQAAAKEYHRNMSYEQTRAHTLKSRFGITLIEYDALAAKQGNKCALCEKPQADLNRPLSVDHCHTTGMIRGLLCRRCNCGVGLWDKNPVLLDEATMYLSDGYGSNLNTSYCPGQTTGFKKGSLEYGRARLLRCKYGIDTQDYDALVEQQNGCCAICHEPQLNLWVDHCHKTKKVRGLLCQGCNFGLGFLEIRPGMTERVRHYLDGELGFGLQVPTCKMRRTDFSRWGIGKERK
jgi:hypothetical protein